MGAGGMLQCWIVPLLSLLNLQRGSSSRLYRCDLAGDGPGEAEHLAGDGGGHQGGILALDAHAAIAGAEADLGFPGDVADRLGLALETIEEAAAGGRAGSRAVRS